MDEKRQFVLKCDLLLHFKAGQVFERTSYGLFRPIPQQVPEVDASWLANQITLVHGLEATV